MKRSELSSIFSMPPDEAVAWLRKKKLRLSWDYTEVWGEAHRRTFTVAKIMTLDLLGDIHRSLTEALEQGKPFKEWQEELRPTLAAKGWYGKTEVINPETGEVKTITVGAHRLRTIYETNMRSAYNYGRYLHQSRSKTLTYWMYVSALLPTTRPSHRAMHGSVYPREHPFWTAHYPPNGYNCKCKVRAYSKSMIERRGLRVKEDYEPFADPGFAHPPAGGLDQVWERKVLDAPKEFRPIAITEKEISDLYDRAFVSADPRITRRMETLKPRFIFDDHISEAVAYDPAAGTILFKAAPTLKQIIHEGGHRLDHVSGWASKRLYNTLILDASVWKRDAAREMLSKYEEDLQLQDLFFLTSRGKTALIETREASYIRKKHIHAEAFANFFQYHISGDREKIEVLQAWFPLSWPKFLKLLESIIQKEP